MRARHKVTHLINLYIIYKGVALSVGPSKTQRPSKRKT